MASRADRACQATGAPVTGIVTVVPATVIVSLIARSEPSGAVPSATSEWLCPANEAGTAIVLWNTPLSLVVTRPSAIGVE
jgi:hypothetical protein